MKTIKNYGLLSLLMTLLPTALWAGSWGDKPENGKTYIISVGQDSKSVLTPYKFTWQRETGLAFQSYTDGNDAQKWKFIAVQGKENCYQLVNADGELALDMALNNPNLHSGFPCMWSQNIGNPTTCQRATLATFHQPIVVMKTMRTLLSLPCLRKCLRSL